MLFCENCDQAATHVLVDYRHNIIEPLEFYCSKHAFDDGREECPCCYAFAIEVYDETIDEYIELLPTYPSGTLDNEGCCCQHP